MGQSIQERSLSRPYHFKFSKGCLPQISLGWFLNSSSHVERGRLDERRQIDW